MTVLELVNKLLLLESSLLVYYPGDGGGLDPADVVRVDRRGFVVVERADG